VILASACAVGQTGTVVQVQTAIQSCVIDRLAAQNARGPDETRQRARPVRHLPAVPRRRRGPLDDAARRQRGVPDRGRRRGPRRRDPKAAGKGWTVTRKGGHGAFHGVGECAVLTKDSHYVKIHAQAWFKVWDGGGKGRLAHAIYAPAVVAETASGHIDVLTGCHTPAHVEGLWARIPLPERVKAKVLLRKNRKPIQTYLTVCTPGASRPCTWPRSGTPTT
jgi:hypothetical protein